MTTNDTAALNDSDRPVTDYPVFGYDREGRAHRYDAVRATVLVTIDGDVVHREQLAKPAVPAWIKFVDEKCGWAGDGSWWHVDNLGTAEEMRQRALDDLATQAAMAARGAI